jgi:glycosyltransferase involved in cell wall biosynthesis
MHAIIEQPAAGQKERASDATGRRPINVCLVIGSLEYGGAERQVVEMMKAFDRSVVNPMVCSLSAEVPLAAALPVRSELQIVEKKSKFDFTTVTRLARLFRDRRIEVVHGFLLDAEIACRLAGRLAKSPVVIASERNTDYVRPLRHTVAQRLTMRLFDLMVANSEAGKRFNVRTLKVPADKIKVVHNGVDIDRFCPNREAGAAFRKQLGIAPDRQVVGMVGNFKRQKDHACFLRMAATVLKTLSSAVFLIAGDVIRGDSQSIVCEKEVKSLAIELGLANSCRFLGVQKDMPAFYNSCDVTALLSRHEGTPNVVLESMACAVPVVVTNVADNAQIVRSGRDGFVVQPGDSASAAENVLKLLLDGEHLGRVARSAHGRAVADFSCRAAAQKLEQIYFGALSSKRAAKIVNAA